MLNHPRVLCAVSLMAMWLMAVMGIWIRQRSKVPTTEDKDNLAIVLSATLTLLGLIIGFTFSMATTRYDQRRLFEEQEANAIGTEYVRADLLPPAERAEVKQGLVAYLDARVAFYQADYGEEVEAARRRSAALQASLWRLMQAPAAAQPTPVTALVISGMNDVLNSQGYTQFAWGNRIPVAAWSLLILIALLANGLIGYAAVRSRSGNLLLLILPVLISISIFLVSDIDSPRGGVIRLMPKDLLSLSQSLRATQQP